MNLREEVRRLTVLAGAGSILGALLFGASILCGAILSASTSARAQEAGDQSTVTHDAAAVTVRVETGALAGTKVGTIEVFKGIPYAAPPVGAMRWEPPAPPARWSDTRAATAFGAICPQPVRTGPRGAVGGGQPQSEDCLFLNVWVPAGAKKAPVMVWIHGGSFRFGSGSMPAYDGSDFAKDGVILVTINYRLGALGFFAHPALTKAAAPGAPLGSYGIMDQLAALRWVKRNIRAFGGDPHNVTVFGESAGGQSVLTLLALPAAKGLFAKAIVESGGGWGRPRTLADAESKGITLVSSAGLGADATVEQLRALPPEKLFNEPRALGGAGPIVDGRLMKQSVTQAFAAGDEIHVPLIIGSNSYEASLMKSFNISPERELALVPASLRALYPANDAEAAAQFFTDSVMGAPARWVAAQSSAKEPAYLYYFSYVATVRRATAPGAQHGSEIPFVFESWTDLLNRTASPEDRAMETLMHACWVGFARTGKPNCPSMNWPAYTPSAGELMEFGTQPGVKTNLRKTQFDALQSAVLARTIDLR